MVLGSPFVSFDYLNINYGFKTNTFFVLIFVSPTAESGVFYKYVKIIVQQITFY